MPCEVVYALVSTLEKSVSIEFSQNDFWKNSMRQFTSIPKDFTLSTNVFPDRVQNIAYSFKAPYGSTTLLSYVTPSFAY